MRKTKVAVIALIAMAVTMTLASASSAGPTSCPTRTNNTHAKLQECVTLEGARTHLAALQAIADANNGIRVSGSLGFDRSVDYAAGVLTAAGYNVTLQPFQFQTFVVLSPTILNQVAPPPAGPVAQNILSYSGSGDVTASVSLPTGDFRGCSATDFVGFQAGRIALISRGAPPGFPVACTFALKTTNAYNAGAAAVIIYNNQAGAPNFTLGADFALNIGVTGVTLAVGQQLVATATSASGLEMRLKTETFRGIATAHNVLAESKTGNPDNVVMVGAHLDSVNAGPGIQDNGSGSAAILEVAKQMAKVKPYNKVRFALWGAEESGLVGSRFYVANLPQAERDKVALYLNFDMIGSPNHVFFVYDGDDSDAVGAGPGPAGSSAIEKAFERFYTARSIPFKGTDFSGRSDYGPFIAAGVDIPSGGLFTGAEGIKTAAEAALWGGTAGQQYDPCYHLACDTFANSNQTAYDVNLDAVAYSTLQYGMTTLDVNGVAGNPDFEAFAFTAAPVAGDGSQGGLHDENSAE